MTQTTNGHVDPAAGVRFQGWTRDEAKLLLQTIGRYVNAQVLPLKARIAELETRLEEVEKNGVRYCGVYQRALSYRRGDQVTHEGARHTALREIAPCEAPLKSEGWQLSDKSERRLPTKGGARSQTMEKRTP